MKILWYTHRGKSKYMSVISILLLAAGCLHTNHVSSIGSVKTLLRKIFAVTIARALFIIIIIIIVILLKS